MVGFKYIIVNTLYKSDNRDDNDDNNIYCILFFLSVALRPNAGHGLLILEVSRSHDAPQSVGLLWTSDQLVAETST
jgi:hypothetical protein